MTTITSNASLTLTKGKSIIFEIGGSGKAIVDGQTYQIGNQEAFIGPFDRNVSVQVFVDNSPINYRVDGDGDMADQRPGVVDALLLTEAGITKGGAALTAEEIATVNATLGTEGGGGGLPVALPAGIPYSATKVLADPTPNEAGAPKFALAVAGGTFNNHPVDGTYIDHVAFLGYNFKLNGIRDNEALPAGGLGWESKFTQGGPDYAQEFYYRCLSADGTERRPFGFYLPYNDLEGSNGDVRLEKYVFGYHQRGSLTLVDRISWDLYAGAYYVKSGQFIFDVNNSAPFAQRNAANSAYLRLPYIDSSNEVVSPDAPYGMVSNGLPITFRGKAGITGNEILSVKNSAGATLFRVGGVPGNTSGIGAGWFGVETDQSTGSGFELKSTATAARTFLCNLEGNGNLIMRQSSGAGQWYMDVYGTLNVRDWSNGAASLLNLNATRALFNQPVGLRSYANVAALPSASGAGAGAMVYVASTTTPGGACIAVSNGTAWKVVVSLDAAATVA